MFGKKTEDQPYMFVVKYVVGCHTDGNKVSFNKSEAELRHVEAETPEEALSKFVGEKMCYIGNMHVLSVTPINPLK